MLSALSIVRVLDALQRASMEQNKKGETSGWVQYSVLVDRLSKEYPKLTASSVPVLTSRYLRKAVAEGYVDREKRGRNVFYKVTREGNLFLIGRRDQLDDVMRWFEAPVGVGLMSFAVAPTGSPLIIEDRGGDDSLHGVEHVEEFMRKIKEMNPGLRSMYLRF